MGGNGILCELGFKVYGHVSWKFLLDIHQNTGFETKWTFNDWFFSVG